MTNCQLPSTWWVTYLQNQTNRKPYNRPRISLISKFDRLQMKLKLTKCGYIVTNDWKKTNQREKLGRWCDKSDSPAAISLAVLVATKAAIDWLCETVISRISPDLVSPVGIPVRVRRKIAGWQWLAASEPVSPDSLRMVVVPVAVAEETAKLQSVE